MLYYENALRKKGYDLIIGVDEAGRGPLAGPVVAAAVALNSKKFKNRIDDSKKLTPFARERAFKEIIAKALFGIGIVDEKIIDRKNIFVSTSLAMEKAVLDLLGKTGEEKNIHIIVDGNVRLNTTHPVTNIIRGDSLSKSIASASILAKVTRDRIMREMASSYPHWSFDTNKGYPCPLHKTALQGYGPSAIHRRSWVFMDHYVPWPGVPKFVRPEQPTLF